MDFKNEFPEYLAIAEHIRRARVENSVYLSHRIAGTVVGMLRFVKRLATPRRYQQREA
jgi:hypothetical protein